MFRVFCACDDDAFCKAVCDAFRFEGEVDFCCKSNNGIEVVGEAIDRHPDLVILEKEKPCTDDLQVCNELKLYMPKVPLFLVTQLEGMLAEKEALSHGIDAVFVKDHDFNSLLSNAFAVRGLSARIA